MARELTRREKLAIVRKHYHEGKKQHTIAQELTCSRQEVGRVLHQFVTTGDVESHWRSGRPSVVTDDVKEVIEKTIKRKRTATARRLLMQWRGRLDDELAHAPCDGSGG